MKLRITLAFLAIATVLFGAVSEFKGDGLTMKFNPSNNFAGFNFGSNATDPANLFSGDAWVNSTDNTAKIYLDGQTRPFVTREVTIGGYDVDDSGKVATYEGDGSLSVTNSFAIYEGVGRTPYWRIETSGITGERDVSVMDRSGRLMVYDIADTPAEGEVATWDDAAGRIHWAPASPASMTLPVEYPVAVSDEVTDLTTGTAKITFRIPYDMTLTGVDINVNTAPTGANIQVDVNKTGVGSLLSTTPKIDVSEKTSVTGVAAVISTSALTRDDELTIDIDQIGSTIAGKGLKLTLIGTRTFTP